MAIHDEVDLGVRVIREGTGKDDWLAWAGFSDFAEEIRLLLEQSGMDHDDIDVGEPVQ